MYVPGTLNDVENVLVNVGTGYYVEKASIFAFSRLLVIVSFCRALLCNTLNLSVFVECRGLKGLLQTQNRIPHEADRKNSASPSGKACNETRYAQLH